MSRTAAWCLFVATVLLGWYPGMMLGLVMGIVFGDPHAAEAPFIAKATGVVVWVGMALVSLGFVMYSVPEEKGRYWY